CVHYPTLPRKAETRDASAEPPTLPSAPPRPPPSGGACVLPTVRADRARQRGDGRGGSTRPLPLLRPPSRPARGPGGAGRPVVHHQVPHAHRVPARRRAAHAGR